MIEALSLLWWIVTAPLRAVQWAARLYVELCFLWAIAVTEVALYAICLTEAVCYKPFDRNTHDRKVLEAAACLERLDAAWAVFWRELEGPTQSERGYSRHHRDAAPAAPDDEETGAQPSGTGRRTRRRRRLPSSGRRPAGVHPIGGMNHAAAEDIGDQSGFPPTPSSLPDAPDGPSATHEEASVTGNDPSPTSQTFPPPPVGPPVVEEQAPATPTDNYATSGSMLAVTDNSTPSTGAPNLSTAHGVSSTSSIVKFFFSPSSTMGSSPPQASASAATTTAADASANATNIAASSSAAPSSSPSTSRSIAAEDAVSSDSSPNTSSHATATDPEAALDDVSSSAAVPPTDSPKTAESSSPAVSSTTIGDRASGAKIDGEPVVAASEHAAAGKSTSGSYDQHLKSAGLNTAAAVFMPSSTHAAVQPKMQGLDIAKEAVTSGSGVSKTETRSMNALREESEAKLSASAPVFEPKSRAEVFYGSSSPRIAAGRVVLEPATSTGRETEVASSFSGLFPIGPHPPPPPPPAQRGQPPLPTGLPPSWRCPMPYGVPAPGPVAMHPMLGPMNPYLVHPQAAFMNGMHSGLMPVPGPGFGVYPAPPHPISFVDVMQTVLAPFRAESRQQLSQQGGHGYGGPQQGHQGSRRRS